MKRRGLVDGSGLGEAFVFCINLLSSCAGVSDEELRLSDEILIKLVKEKT
jgi:hypothetical protein